MEHRCIPPEAMPYLGIALAQAQGHLSGYFRRVVDPNELIRVASHYYHNCPHWGGTVEVLREIVTELHRRAALPRPGTGHRPMDRLRTINIVELAERHTSLTPAGQDRLKGCCPLHQEKTPSFYVFSATQRWRCFGACAVGGDTIDLASRLSGFKGIVLVRWAESQGLIAPAPPATRFLRDGAHPRKRYLPTVEVKL